MPDFNSLPHRVAVAAGSNLGDSAAILTAAIKTLAHRPQIELQAQSPIYRTKAVGPLQPDYLNCCLLLGTKLDPQAVLALLLQIETQFGRVRRERWGPRLLDLDLLLFDDLILHQPNLVIPHPHMAQRAFVLVPLSDIAPRWVEPVSHQTIVELMQRVDRSGVVRFDPEQSISEVKH